VVAAFGDNLDEPARELAAGIGLPPGALERLRELGRCLNYNAYGETEADLIAAPAALYRAVARYPDPLAFVEAEPLFARLASARAADLAAARAVAPRWSKGRAVLFVLPDAPWSRRVMGSYANHLAAADRGRAVAVLVPVAGGGYIVSVRAPERSSTGADELCRKFPTGGGRRDAAGVDRLPATALGDFERAFADAFA
jgi:hypothetical protein